ncbi:MAG TPA: IS200/IS605 family transposase [Planctomycetota bacterium]|nr:IS200/IS605 family transposase [Planctomycetota bacterium]
MPHSYTLSVFHMVFSTDRRVPMIRQDLQPRLQEYAVGIARKKNIHIYAVGGMQDHQHLLMAIPATMALATAAQLLKGNLSRWLNQTKELAFAFAWQEGYAAFSVSASQIPTVKKYIDTQAEHHRMRDFRTEYLALLRKHNIKYDPLHVMD